MTREPVAPLSDDPLVSLPAVPHADQPGQAGYAWRPSLSYTTQWGTIGGL